MSQPTSSSASEPPGGKHIDWLDATRGAAVLAVIGVHCAQVVPDTTGSFFMNRGHYGVQFFFLISAYTLALLYHGRLNTLGSLVDFGFRRFFRLWPLYFLGVLYYGAHAPWPDRVINMILLHGFHPTAIDTVVPGGWSIGVEVQFYIILPLLFFLIRGVGSAIILFTCSIFLTYYASSGHVIPYFWEHGFVEITRKDVYVPITTIWFPRNLSFFSAGLLIYHLFGDFSAVRWKGKALAELSRYGLLPFFAVYLICASSLVADPTVTQFRPILICIFLSLLFIYVGIGRPRILVNVIMCRLGLVSYGMYLVHFGILGVLHEPVYARLEETAGPDATLALFFALIVGLSWLAAEGLRWAIEKRGIALGRYLSVRLFPSASQSPFPSSIYHRR